MSMHTSIYIYTYIYIYIYIYRAPRLSRTRCMKGLAFHAHGAWKPSAFTRQVRPSLDLYLYLHFFRLHCTVPPVLPRRRCAHRAPPLSLKTYNYGQFPALNRSRPTTVVNFQP